MDCARRVVGPASRGLQRAGDANGQARADPPAPETGGVLMAATSSVGVQAKKIRGMEIVPSGDVIGAEICGVDLAQLSDAEFERIEAAFNAHAVLCFRDQLLTEAQLLSFGRRF